jgi:uncharacterized OB-fold protein
MPHRDSVAGPWRLKESRYTLNGTVCSCGAMHMPPRRVCECGKESLEKFTFSGSGKIISYTTIHVAPAGFEHQTPYNVALIELDEGPVISGVVVGSGLDIGVRVKSVFRRLQTAGEKGVITYGFKFEVIDDN